MQQLEQYEDVNFHEINENTGEITQTFIEQG